METIVAHYLYDIMNSCTSFLNLGERSRKKYIYIFIVKKPQIKCFIPFR